MALLNSKGNLRFCTSTKFRFKVYLMKDNSFLHTRPIDVCVHQQTCERKAHETNLLIFMKIQKRLNFFISGLCSNGQLHHTFHLLTTEKERLSINHQFNRKKKTFPINPQVKLKIKVPFSVLQKMSFACFSGVIWPPTPKDIPEPIFVLPCNLPL